jgi:hypothetical protein
MTDAAFGYLLLAIGITFVLGVVYAITSHISVSTVRPKPPRGLPQPQPRPLPVNLTLGGPPLGAGLASRADHQLANPFLAIPGVAIFLYAVVAWVRAAGREWNEVERGPHDDAAGH